MNIAGGGLPPPENNGTRYLKIPLDALEGQHGIEGKEKAARRALRKAVVRSQIRSSPTADLSADYHKVQQTYTKVFNATKFFVTTSTA